MALNLLEFSVLGNQFTMDGKVITIDGPLKEEYTAKVCGKCISKLKLKYITTYILTYRLIVRKVVICSLVDITYHFMKQQNIQGKI